MYTERFNLNLPIRESNIIRNYSHDDGKSLTQVFIEAIRLYEHVRKEKEKGNSILVGNTKDGIVKELVVMF